MATFPNSSQNSEMNQHEANKNKGRIVYEIDLESPPAAEEKLWDGMTFDRMCFLEFYKKLNGKMSTIDLPAGESVQVAGIDWQIIGQRKCEKGFLWSGRYYKHGVIDVHTFLLSLACSGIQDGMEYDVTGQMSVHLKSRSNAKSLKFSRTFSATKTSFLGDFMEIDPFVDLRLMVRNKEDRIIVEVTFTVVQREAKQCLKEDLIMLKVNENYLEVDKFLLAFHSEYFKSLFFGNRFPDTKHEVQMPSSTTLEDFKQLLEILEEKSRLNDESIQGTFILANFFGFPKLEAKCRNFLVEKSKHSIIFKYRLSDICGLTDLRDNILENMAAEDVGNKETFMEKCRQLDKHAFSAFHGRLEELIALEKNELSESEESGEDESDEDDEEMEQ